jgi:hypothetical protein
MLEKLKTQNMRNLLIVCIILLFHSCNISQSELNDSNQNNKSPSNIPLSCLEIKRNYKNVKITELGKLSNLKLLNGIKWINFENPIYYYANCLSNIETIEDFIIGNINDFDFLDKIWDVEIIAYKGHIIKITLNSNSKSFKNEISEVNSIRNDFIKLLGKPKDELPRISEQLKNELTAYVITTEDEVRINQNSIKIRNELINYHKTKPKTSFTLDEIMSSINDPANEKYSNPSKYHKNIKGYFNYYSLLSFEDIWENELYLKCTYKRTSSLDIVSKDNKKMLSKLMSGYIFKTNWMPVIEIYREKKYKNIENTLLSLKEQESNEKILNENKLEEEEFINKF